MSSHLYRLWAMALVPIALIACTNSGTLAADQSTAPPLGVDLGGSGRVSAAHTGEGHAPYPQHRSGMQMAHAGHNDAHGTGTSIPSTRRSIRSISATSPFPSSAGRR
jgi:hypothetical protein